MSMSFETKENSKQYEKLRKAKYRTKKKTKAEVERQALFDQQHVESNPNDMLTLSIIYKNTCNILKQRNAYLPDPNVPPGIQEKIDHNILKLAGEVIVRQAMDRENEPGGIQCIDALYEYLGIPLPAHLEFPISIDQRVELEDKRN